MPVIRLGRLRKNQPTRDWVSQTGLNPGDIILPYFVAEGTDIADPIRSIPALCCSVDARIWFAASADSTIVALKDSMVSPAC